MTADEWEDLTNLLAIVQKAVCEVCEFIDRRMKSEIKNQLCKAVAAAFDHQDFVFELKHDGFRAVAYIEDGTCRLISRKQIQYKSFAGLCTAMAGLPVKNAILDGELVCLDQDGRSQFRQLMRRKSQDVCFYAFDLLWLDGHDLRGLPLLERKSRLRKLVRGRTGFLYAEHVPVPPSPPLLRAPDYYRVATVHP
jgi:bifunctional non-homologous end joining protein LigD